MINLKQQGTHFFFLSAVFANFVDQILNHLLRWLIHEVDFLHLIWFALEKCLGLLIQPIILIINVFKFNQSNSSRFVMVLNHIEETHHLIDQFDEFALILKPEKVLNILLFKSLEGLE